METQYLKCNCEIVSSEINTQNEKQFSSKSIYESFYSVLKYSNYKVLKCSILAFSIKSITNNIGSIISVAYFLIHSIFFIIYILKGINPLKKDFSKIIIKNSDKTSFYISNNINGKYVNNKIKKENKKKVIKEQILKEKRIIENNKKKKPNIKTKNKFKGILIMKTPKRKKNGFQRVIFDYPPKKNISKEQKIEIISNNILNISKRKNKNIITIINKTNSLYSLNKNSINKEGLNQQIYNVLKVDEEKLDNYELNDLEFNEAKKLDKRNFLNIYWSLLRREHLIIFTFITKDDHNLKYIKYSRFAFLLCTDMAMNVFFFSDETMHKIFLDYGKYNFIQQIPQILYSTIVTKILEIFLCYLSMTGIYFYKIKKYKNINKNTMLSIIQFIQIKLYCFLGFTTTMFFFYWYLITCFCAVYQNTQIAFIKDIVLSFILGNLIPFAIYLLPSLFRILALKTKIFGKEWIYNISNIIPFF